MYLIPMQPPIPFPIDGARHTFWDSAWNIIADARFLRATKSQMDASYPERGKAHLKLALRLTVSLVLMGAAAAFVIYNFGIADALNSAKNLSAPVMAVVLGALLLNALAASLRFKLIAADVGHIIGLRQAIASVSAGSLAGAAFFQLAGQLMARGALMSRGDVPFAAVVVMTAWERVVAAAISAILAMGGAYFLFGRVVLDLKSGGSDLIHIIVGLILAAVAGAALGYGRKAMHALGNIDAVRAARRIALSASLSLLVQLAMMIGYVVAAHALSPQTPLPDLIAASAIVMFAASVPISFAGWGVREMSAVIALGAIGVASDKALVIAVLIGAGSMLTMAVLAALSVSSWRRPSVERIASAKNPLDYRAALAFALPLGTATFVLFQVHIPLTSGTLLNANIADPIAILGASVMLLYGVPRWRLPFVNISAALATMVLVYALLIGFSSFGYTEWAMINRFLGWFVLIAYALTGALIVRQTGPEGLQMLLLTFVGAMAAVIAFELALLVAYTGGVRSLSNIVAMDIRGFAQNRNSFAFQITMALCATLVLTHMRGRLWIIVLLLAGLWFCGSRSGWIAAAVILAAGMMFKTVNARALLKPAMIAGVLSIVPLLIVFAVASFPFLQPDDTALRDHFRTIRAIPDLLPQSGSTSERLLSWWAAWELFTSNPIFGAGLGAFRNLNIFSPLEKAPLVVHSSYLWLIAETGILGALAFVVPAAWLMLVEIKREERDQASILLILCLLAMGIMAAPADMLYQRTFWLLLGAGLAVHWTKSKPAP